MEYEIKYEPINHPKEGMIDKYNIYYYGGEFDGLGEFHSYDGINGNIRLGYSKLGGAKVLLTDEQLIAAFNRLKQICTI